MDWKKFLALTFGILFVLQTVSWYASDNRRNDQISLLRDRIVADQKQIVKDRAEYAKLSREIDVLQTKLNESETKRVAAEKRASRSKRVTIPHITKSTIHMGPLNWAALRRCENGGSYTSKPGDRYRGAYQFDQSTWNGVARRHSPRWVGVDPAAAPASVQDQFALWLYKERGRQPWPTCGRLL